MASGFRLNLILIIYIKFVVDDHDGPYQWNTARTLFDVKSISLTFVFREIYRIYLILKYSRGGSEILTKKDMTENKIWLEFEFLTAVTMASAILWDMTRCRPVEVHRRSSETLLNMYPSTWRQYFSEMAVNSHQTARRYMSDDSTLQDLVNLLIHPT
jgi:hypothetical protein